MIVPPPMPTENTDPITEKVMRIEERHRQVDNRKHPEYGLCSKCRHMSVRVHTVGANLEKFAQCEMYSHPNDGRIQLPLSPHRPVRDCARYWPIGAPTIREMLAEAKLLFVTNPGNYL